MFRNMMVMLGLGPDEEYEDRYLDDGYDEGYDSGYDDGGQGGVQGGGVVASRSIGDDVVARPLGSNDSTQPSAVGAVRPLRPVASDDQMTIGSAVPTAMTAAEPSNVRSLVDPAGDEPTVRPMAIQRTKPRVLTPQSFGDAKVLADEFKRSVPVIMNLQAIDRDLARRLIDFSSGVCYSMSGSMEKMAPHVFLLTPRNVEVSDEDRRRIEERGFDR